MTKSIFKTERWEKVTNTLFKNYLTSLALREIPIFHKLDWQILERLVTPNAEEGVGNKASETVKCESLKLVQKGPGRLH